MARVARIRSSSGRYHVMLRGINKQTIFESDDDRYRFLSVLEEYTDANKFVLYAYCLMDNHVHLLIEELEDDISTAIKRLSSSYVIWYNNKYERCGHLFQERFKSEPVETDGYLITVLRYIHQNPIKAGLCKSVNDYKWDSYREYINEPKIIDNGLCLSLFSDNKDKARELFVDYMNEDNDDDCLELEEYYKLRDQDVMEIIYDMEVGSISELQKLNKAERDLILKRLKGTKGVTLRQISRITGISKSLIGKL